jgi:RNA methyltransferase, TrmH family
VLLVKVNSINSPTNALLKRVRSLHERKFRDKLRQFLIEGARAVDEGFQKHLNITDVLVSETFLNEHESELEARKFSEIAVVDDRLFKEVSTTITPGGILAVAEMPVFEPDDLFAGAATLIVVANAIQDPGNLGTIMRTALAANASGMMLITGTVDPFNPKVVRSAMGALFALPLLWDLSFEDAMENLKQRSVRILACDASGSTHVFDSNMRGPVALVVGNEGNGFAPGQLEAVDEIVSLPMNPLSESLNVAVTAAVALFNVVQQRIKSEE